MCMFIIEYYNLYIWHALGKKKRVLKDPLKKFEQMLITLFLGAMFQLL